MTSSRPRVGLIGAGGISPVHLQGWLALDAEVVIFSEEGAQALADAAGDGHDVTVVAELAAVWPRVDVVDIVTPTATHAELALAAIAQGKHVVCEKPLARTSAEAAQVVAAAEAAGVHLYPAHVVRYFPEYAAAHDAVTGGQVGKVAVCRFRRMSSAPKAEWFYDEAVSGGIVLDQMIHDLDQAYWMAGPVASVFARSTTTETEDGKTASATVTMRHTSGALSYCFGVWGHPGLPFTYSFEVAGDKGQVGYDKELNDSSRLHLSTAQDSGGYIPRPPVSDSPYAAEIQNFWAAISTGTTPDVTGTDGVHAIELAEAALASIASGQTQHLPGTEEGSRR